LEYELGLTPMGNKKLAIHNTDTDNLISNLRGEVGEIIFSWTMMRSFMAQSSGLRTADIQKDLENRQLIAIDSLVDKLCDEIVARLSELAEKKVGQLTFYFAQAKLNQLENETAVYSLFIEKERFREKRNHDISHKELPEKWGDHKAIYIPYEIIVRGIALALRLMKAIDRIYLGPQAKYQWRELRRRRYMATYPAKVGYMLMHYIWLPSADRINIIKEENEEGRNGWTDMKLLINGKEATIKAYGKWGVIRIGRRIIDLGDPFVELTSINFPVRDTDPSHQIDSRSDQP
jgi:hypothetical protein